MTYEEIVSEIVDAHKKVKNDFLKKNKRVVLYSEYAKAINDFLGYELYPVDLLLASKLGYIINENTNVTLTDEDIFATMK